MCTMDILESAAKRYLPRRIVAFLDRARVWISMLRSVRGRTLLDRVKLLISAVLDPFLVALFPSERVNPSAYFDMVVHSDGLAFHIRRRSDDIWHVFPWREARVYGKIRELLQTGCVFIDCGANIGFYSLVASHLAGQSGTVIAIEMLETNVKSLTANLRLNDIKNVSVIKGALFRERGIILEASYKRGQYGLASILVRSGGNSCRVKTVTLDEICARLERIRLVKLDIEGAEYDALLGAAEVLRRTDYILFESWPGWYQTDKVFDLLRDRGFLVHALDDLHYIARRTR